MKEHKTFVPYSFLFTEQKQFCSGGCSCLRKLGLEVILRIDNSGLSMNCTAPINEVWTGCSQRTYYILHIIRLSNIIPIC